MLCNKLQRVKESSDKQDGGASPSVGSPLSGRDCLLRASGRMWRSWTCAQSPYIQEQGGWRRASASSNSAMSFLEVRGGGGNKGPFSLVLPLCSSWICSASRSRSKAFIDCFRSPLDSQQRSLLCTNPLKDWYMTAEFGMRQHMLHTHHDTRLRSDATAGCKFNNILHAPTLLSSTALWADAGINAANSLPGLYSHNIVMIKEAPNWPRRRLSVLTCVSPN